jgi:hypothetical protein
VSVPTAWNAEVSFNADWGMTGQGGKALDAENTLEKSN